MRPTTFAVSLLVVVLAINGCSYNPYKATNKSYKQQAKAYGKVISQQPLATGADSVPIAPYWVGTTNFNLRKPNFVVIHHTAQNSCAQTFQTFTLVRTQVSAHYVICRDGTVHHMLNDYLRAWQAGVGRWGNVTDINSVSIGIELDNNGFEVFPEVQIASMLHLLTFLKKTYNIPAANFIGHADIAPGRKVDPSIYFPWKQLADKGFGLWYGDTTHAVVPEGFNHMLALRVIGYDVRDSSATIEAFNRHFLQDSSRVLNEAGEKVLYELYQRY